MDVRSAVRTKDQLSPKAFIEGTRANRDLRKAGVNGIVTSFIGDDFMMVRHPGDSASAIYFLDEVEETPAYWTVTRDTEAGPFFKEFDDFEEITEYLEDLGVDESDVTIDGPIFGTKELSEGLVPLRDMFDHLLEDDVL